MRWRPAQVRRRPLSSRSAADQPQIAAPVYALSPLFVDADLVDAVATGGAAVQAAVASRAALPRSVAAAIAEVGTAEACLLLVENRDADIAPFSVDRIVERFGHLAAMREALLARDDFRRQRGRRLSPSCRRRLPVSSAKRAWLDADHADRIAREACEKATVTIAADTPEFELRPLIRHLCASGQLTAGLILRALLSGNITLFEEALAELTGMPVARVSGLVHDRGSAGLRALFDKAALPPSTYPAFKEAIEAMREGFVSEPGGAARFKRRMIERVLTRCEDRGSGRVGAAAHACCAASPPRPPARKRGCSATSLSRKTTSTSARSPPDSSCKPAIGASRTRLSLAQAGRERRR